jgi:metal-responsive CopG/Arc/MetJ family transcriptional regulator
MPRNPQTTTAFTVSLPVPMAQQIERVRKAEHRSRSELTREAFRVYFRTKAEEDEGRAAAARARAGIGVSRAYDNADEFVADLKTAARRLKTKRPSR